MTPGRRGWWVAQVILALLVVGLGVGYLIRNWAAFRAQELVVVVRPGWLLLALGIVLATFALLIEAWRRVVLSQGERLRPLPAARIWLLASLGKYLPGKVWAIAGAAILAEREGVRRSVAVTAAFVLQCLALGSGVLLVAVLAPASLAAQGSWLVIGTGLLGGGALVGLSLLTSAPALTWLRQRLPSTWPVLDPISWRVLLGGLFANVTAWLAYGAALVCLARGLLPSAVPDWPLAVAAFTLSYLVGLVAVFAPAGVGPRESLFILLLAGPLGPKAALGLAVASRILLTITELGAALPFFFLRGAGVTARDHDTTTR